MTSVSFVVSKFGDFLVSKPITAPPVPAGRTIRLGTHDHEELISNTTDDFEDSYFDAELGWAEGQTFIICYVDSSGHESERRITVRNLRLNADNIPLLVAWCHEREATRTFRLDRIRAVVDRDGEIIEPPTPFFVETFGMSPGLAACDAPNPVSLVRIRKAFTNHLMPLAHLACVDGYSDADEQGVIFEHCLHLAHNAGMPATSAEEKSLQHYLHRLKPTKNILDRALLGLEREKPKRIIGLLTAAHRVMDADGYRDPAEQEFLSRIKKDLIGL